jgi:cold shock protein
VKNYRIFESSPNLPLNLRVMETGTVKFFNEKKGYGFIIDEKTEKDVFVHHTGLLDPIANDDRVSFEYSEDERGKKAINVKKEV